MPKFITSNKDCYIFGREMFSILLYFSANGSFELEGCQAEVATVRKETDAMVAFGGDNCKLDHWDEGKIGDEVEWDEE